MIQTKIKQLEYKETVTRDELQSLCSEIQGNCLLYWSPRVGKTRAAINMITKEDKVLVCSNRQLIRDKWINELEGYDFVSICYQSVHKELNQYTVIILDKLRNCPV